MGVVLLSLVSLAGCHPAARDVDEGRTAEAERPPIVVTVASAESRPVRRTIEVVGTLYGYERVALASKVEGRVGAWHYDVGDRVVPGAVLLEIESTDFELAVVEARRGVEQELARLGIDDLPVQGFDIETLPSVARSQLLLENARRRFDRQRALVEGRAAAREAYEQAETDLRVSEAVLKQTRMEARWSVAAVRQRQAALAVAEQRLADCRLLAPPLPPQDELRGRDYVVARRMTAVGEVVRAVPATTVYELVVDSLLKLRAMVPERASAEIRVGQSVEVRVDAYPDQVFAGRIQRINPTIDPRSRSFEIEVAVPNDDHRLRPGGFAKGDVVLAASDAAITVPPEALVALAGVVKVFVLEDKSVREVPVTIGARERDWVEIREGIQAGDRVVTSGQSQLYAGALATERGAAP